MTIIDTLLNPNGRISRLGFWAWAITLFLLISVIAFLNNALWANSLPTSFESLRAQPVGPWLVLALPLLWIGFCLLAKRWHDRGKSGWWSLVALIPVVGQLWALVECGFMAGQRGTNRFGPSPDGYRARLSSYRLEDMPEDMP
ncbi:DUF805 domain-containing protein [Asticcacaulis sp. YBE204]|uniref:DUF805 domain-containing protein n=1 Tax=Asticcacaulis sp. YBE204 TaxID=1282363 RepID=UPI0003C3E363|nr:DUF805 domain-containing protein [Asticcacaulis sp. YBE204]ESQ78261.1 hypothetical protein AEYBE204_15615 [Asticcacaulis sp. YBE204]